ncbi:hypothetical protein KCP76_19270 [Salmonella enterica subsp. enterica serovar Weltevreden]|nr:hypothetical protein KCP76_19270 [Salmonella enterica subsp. enterica serovar Weltevreden]
MPDRLSPEYYFIADVAIASPDRHPAYAHPLAFIGHRCALINNNPHKQTAGGYARRLIATRLVGGEHSTGKIARLTRDGQATPCYPPSLKKRPG